MLHFCHCPICEGPGIRLFANSSLGILKCRLCAHQWYGEQLPADHVQRQYDDDYFNGGGVGYHDYLSESELITAQGRRYAQLLGGRQADTSANMLDVGCAAGFVMQGFASAGWRPWGVDPNASMVAHANDAAVGPAGTVSFDSSDAVSAVSGLHPPAGGFDLIAMVQVVAHLTDLSQALRNIDTLLAPGGRVLIETWNSDSRTARWLGQRWHEYSPPNVLHYFSPISLDGWMAQAGLRREQSGRPVKRLNLGHARSLMAYKVRHCAPARILTSLTMSLPAHWTVAYPAEDLFYAVYRR